MPPNAKYVTFAKQGSFMQEKIRSVLQHFILTTCFKSINQHENQEVLSNFFPQIVLKNSIENKESPSFYYDTGSYTSVFAVEDIQHGIFLQVLDIFPFKSEMFLMLILPNKFINRWPLVNIINGWMVEFYVTFTLK